MAEGKVYWKAGLATAAGLLALTAVAFYAPSWREQKAQSPHYRQDACGVCHIEMESSVLKADELALCTSCHEREGDVEVNGVKVDLGKSHPFGIGVSQRNYPLTLPLTNGVITCQTCHDVHLDNAESHMLRLYGKQANGKPDWTVLCRDCHKTH